ncbi:S1 family peptidase [Deinococcus ruber]|uniref:Serine protease n=1 Tax=Deinococcus ruber TaxID=1848197 RepID=A0A918FDI6_9DEIO|nr:serine protease [Deinococcus ruber]GGR33555.1 hypothetical protein GCM10008957_49740 [Deinococcus ruber]
MMVLGNMSEMMMYSTLRIFTNTGGGSGFVYLKTLSPTLKLPYLITNKHVLENVDVCWINFHCADESTLLPNGKNIRYDFTSFDSSNYVAHPNPDIDLCAIPLLPVFLELNSIGSTPFTTSVTEETLIDQATLSTLSAIEDITMVGYPIGLSDEANNFPIMRRGITASHPNIDFNGTPQGVIDIAAFPGSSGSPIFLFNERGYRTRTGEHFPEGTRLRLLVV